MTGPIIDSIFDIVNAPAAPQPDKTSIPVAEGAPQSCDSPQVPIASDSNTGAIENEAAIKALASTSPIFDAVYEAVNSSVTAPIISSHGDAAATGESHYPEWRQALETIADTGGTVLIVGQQDSGKTSFARRLTTLCEATGRSAAYIDADLKQGEVGPPGCLGLSINKLESAGHSWQSSSTAGMAPMAFIGSTTPQRRYIEYLTGLRLLLDRVPGRHVIIDVGGISSGGATGNRHANALLSLLKPSHVVVLQRRDEHQDIIAAARRRASCTVHQLPIASAIHSKNSLLRSKRLVTQFASYFEGSQIVTVGFDDVTLLGTWLGGGKPLASHLLKFVSNTVGPAVRVFYGEQSDRHLGLMVDRPVPDPGASLGIVHDQLKSTTATLTEAPRLKHLLLGMEDGNGNMLGLGLLQAMDFNRRTLGIQTPMRSPLAARAIHFGEMRMQPDGTQLGMLRSGEL